MPDTVCREEMQNATLENDVIIEHIIDAQGRKVKKLKPLLIKSEPDREHVHQYTVMIICHQYRKNSLHKNER